jgi:valyl-tRNA synthetase
VIVAREKPMHCSKCQGNHLVQETDVLDTWFSSALWPFSTLGWPDKTDELKTFYPTTTMVTGFDILFFWVARMMMMGIHFMGDVPFRDVYIHALVRDAYGKKMSKSKGNVIDPLNVIDQFGTDAFRFTLAALAAQGRDIKLSEERIAGYRHFVNKLWNSARLVLMNLDGGDPVNRGDLVFSLADRWILSRLHQVSEEVTKALEEYRFNDGASLCYQFVWHEFCDWYLEMAKEGIYSQNGAVKGSTLSVLVTALKAVVKLLHPFMPFVTEEIWQRLPGVKGSVMTAPFPKSTEFVFDGQAVKELSLVMGAIAGIRNIRGEMNIPPFKKVDVVIEAPDLKDAEILRSNLPHLRNLAKVESIDIRHSVAKPKGSATAVFGQNQVHVILKGLLDFEEEKKRLRKDMDKVKKDLEMLVRKLSNPQFREKAAAEVIEEVKEKKEALDLRLEKLTHNLKFFESI